MYIPDKSIYCSKKDNLPATDTNNQTTLITPGTKLDDITALPSTSSSRTPLPPLHPYPPSPHQSLIQLSKEDELESLAPLLLLSEELLAVFFIRRSVSGRLPSLDCSISSIRSDLLLEWPLSPDTEARFALSSCMLDKD